MVGAWPLRARVLTRDTIKYKLTLEELREYLDNNELEEGDIVVIVDESESASEDDVIVEDD